MKKISWAKHFNKPVDGHAPGLRGEPIKKYIAAGISTDHECFTREEALDKLAHGMKILIREGSAKVVFQGLRKRRRDGLDEDGGLGVELGLGVEHRAGDGADRRLVGVGRAGALVVAAEDVGVSGVGDVLLNLRSDDHPPAHLVKRERSRAFMASKGTADSGF